MPTNAQGWVKPELRVSIMRVKHLKDTGCHAVEVELDGQKPKRTAWVDGGNDKEFNREAGFFLKGDQQANNADFWNKAFVHITVILERTFRSDKNAAACHLSMKVIRKYGEVRGWVTLLHNGHYAGEMLLRAKLQGVDNWKDKQKGPASEAAVNLPFNGAPDSNTANWESYNAMMVAAAPMGAPGVFGAMQMQKDAKDGTIPVKAEGTPVPMSQEEYHTQIAMLRDIEARHAKDVESQREQWVKQEEEARNRAIQQRQQQGDDEEEEESSSDEEPEEDAADKRKGYPAHMKLDDDNDDSDSDDGYDDARPSNQVDAMTENCEGLMTMLHWDSDRPGDRGGIVVPPRGQVAASRAGPVIPQQPHARPVDGGWGAATKSNSSNVWNTGDFASLDIAAAQVQSSQGNPFQQQQQRPITPLPPQRMAAPGGYRNVTPPSAPRQQQHPPVGRAPGGYYQQQPGHQQQARVASPPPPPAAQQQQPRQPYYVYQGPPPNSVPASAVPRPVQTPQQASQRYASPPPPQQQTAQPQGYAQYNRAPQAASPQRPGTPPPQYQRPAQMPNVQYAGATPSRAQPVPYTPPSNSVPLGRLGDYSSAPPRPSPPAANMVYNTRGAMPTQRQQPMPAAGQYAPAPQVQQRKPGDPFASLNPFANGGGFGYGSRPSQ